MARQPFTRTRISANAPRWGRRKQGRGMEPQRRWAYCLLGVVAGLTTTLWIVAHLSRGPELDPQTLCERGIQPPGHVVVLVGLYEPLTAAQAHAARSEILRRTEDLQVGERLSILALTPNNAGPATRPLFSKCRPRDGTDASWLFENPRMLQKRYHDDFEKPLADAIEGLESLGRTDASLLLAALREAVTLPSFRSARQRGFVVISHHSPASFSLLPPEALPIMDSRGALSGANVLLLQLMSEKTRHYQHTEHQQFWHDYLLAAGAPRYELKWVYRGSCPSLLQGAWQERGELMEAIERQLREEATPVCRTELLQQKCQALLAWAKQRPVGERIAKLEEAEQVVTELNDPELQPQIAAELRAARAELQLVSKDQTIQAKDRTIKAKEQIIKAKDTAIQRLQRDLEKSRANSRNAQ